MESTKIESLLIPVHDRASSFYGKAVIIRDPRRHTTYLKSYATVVCKIVNGRFYRTWDGYSVTTMRHVDEFRRQFGFDGISKKAWENMPVVKA